MWSRFYLAAAYLDVTYPTVVLYSSVGLNQYLWSRVAARGQPLATRSGRSGLLRYGRPNEMMSASPAAMAASAVSGVYLKKDHTVLKKENFHAMKYLDTTRHQLSVEMITPNPQLPMMETDLGSSARACFRV